MATDTATTVKPARFDHAPTLQTPQEAALRRLAVRRLAQIRRFKVYAAMYVLAMVVLTPVWIVSQYAEAGGWPKHLSSRSRYPGDWDPWLIWVALLGAVLVAFAARRAYRRQSDGDLDREIALESKRRRPR